MYVDMSMLEWVDQTQMAPEAGVVNAAQKDNVETSYRSEEFTFAAIVQYFEESRLASKIWQHARRGVSKQAHKLSLEDRTKAEQQCSSM